MAGRSPVDRGKQGLKRSGMTDGYGIPLGRVLAGANRHDSPLLAPILDRLDDLGSLPDDITVHLDAGYDSDKPAPCSTNAACTAGSHTKARRRRSRPVRGGTWSAPTPGRTPSTASPAATSAGPVIDAFFDLADAVITVRSLIRQAWTSHRWDERPHRRP